MKVSVVGAGLGGLAAAARLANKGYQVDVFERQQVPGGKAAELHVTTENGPYRFDLGPSLFTMPQILDELFADCGEHRQDHLQLHPVSPSCRYFWSDGQQVDEDQHFWQRPEVARYLQHAKGIYDLSAEAFLNRAPGDFWRGLKTQDLLALRHFLKVATFESLADLNARFFADPYLRQIFDRFATYNGSDPARTLATFAIIPYVEAAFGAWYPHGGMARLGEALAALAERQGAKIHYGQHVDNLLSLPGDVVVCNGDVISAHQDWLPQDKRAHSLRKHELSLSGYVLLLGLNKKFAKLAHHNIFFSDDYPAEFRQIFAAHELPEQPTIYVAISARSQVSDAPQGGENWFVLVNAPADKDLDIHGYDQVVLQRLRQFGVDVKTQDIAVQRSFGPGNFWQRDQAFQGALYGWASHGLAGAVRRPAMRHHKHRNIFFVGGSTHPGGGIPLVLRSGKLGAGLVEKNFPV